MHACEHCKLHQVFDLRFSSFFRVALFVIFFCTWRSATLPSFRAQSKRRSEVLLRCSKTKLITIWSNCDYVSWTTSTCITSTMSLYSVWMDVSACRASQSTLPPLSGPYSWCRSFRKLVAHWLNRWTVLHILYSIFCCIFIWNKMSFLLHCTEHKKGVFIISTALVSHDC